MRSVKVFCTDGAVFEILKKNFMRKNFLSLLKYGGPLGILIVHLISKFNAQKKPLEKFSKGS